MRVFFISTVLLWNSIAFSQAREFTYEDLIALIQSRHYTKIEDVLPNLPESFRSNYLLMHSGRGLQNSTPMNPRAIMFGENAKFTCSFNGSPEQTGFDTMECFQFRTQEKKFDFHQIVFPSERNHFTEVVFSETNHSADGSPQCTSCHGADPRPNWETYSTWPGAYGSSDDRVIDDNMELNNYKQFVANRSSHPRYRYLIQDSSDPDAPYMTNQNITAERRPNLRFSDFVGRMNGLRTGRILASKVPIWQQWEFVIGAFQRYSVQICQLNDAQKRAIADAHLPAPTFDLQKIFALTGVPAKRWGTAFVVEPAPDRGYEHQSGFNFLSMDTAMAIIVKRASEGNQTLRDAIQNMKSGQTDSYLAFFQKMNEILPDPDFFGNADANIKLLCPEVTRIFTEEYLRQ